MGVTAMSQQDAPTNGQAKPNTDHLRFKETWAQAAAASASWTPDAMIEALRRYGADRQRKRHD